MQTARSWSRNHSTVLLVITSVVITLVLVALYQHYGPAHAAMTTIIPSSEAYQKQPSSKPDCPPQKGPYVKEKVVERIVYVEKTTALPVAAEVCVCTQ